MENKKYWIWFSRIEKIRPLMKYNLLVKYKSVEKIFNLDKEELLKQKDIKSIEVNEILNKKYKNNLEKYEEYMEKNKIEIIDFYSNYYPKKLKDIYDPPICLFIKGNKHILNNFCIGIVGCRQCSNYGIQVAKKIAYELSKNDIVIVSGLAKGIDKFAHLGSIIAKEKTIAVLGNGLDIIYPLENKQIYNKIIETKGTLISEYIVGTKPLKENFPKRNRIISGISESIIVVEAKKNSGTMITVDYALEQGKEVYAIPGNINNVNSEGTNLLIKQGANIFTSLEDIQKPLDRNI